MDLRLRIPINLKHRAPRPQASQTQAKVFAGAATPRSKIQIVVDFAMVQGTAHRVASKTPARSLLQDIVWNDIASEPPFYVYNR
jgi:hypothetical protein